MAIETNTEAQIRTYATVTDVESLNRARKLGVGSGMPGADDVLGYLQMSAGEIETILINKGYALPIPAGAVSALQVLRDINAKGALVRLEKASPTSPRLKQFEEEYEHALEKLADAEFSLDAPLESERARPRGPGGSEPFFKRDMKF